MTFLISAELNLATLFEDEQRNKKSDDTRMRKENIINLKKKFVFMAHVLQQEPQILNQPTLQNLFLTTINKLVILVIYKHPFSGFINSRSELRKFIFNGIFLFLIQ